MVRSLAAEYLDLPHANGNGSFRVPDIRAMRQTEPGTLRFPAEVPADRLLEFNSQ